MIERVTAKKSLGQNFLVNAGVVARIVGAAGLTSDDAVLEVGPGTGTLTEALAATGARVVAVEKDRRLIPRLRDRFASSPNVGIVEGDALTLEPGAHGLAAGSYKVVANIPYYLSARLLRLALASWPRPERLVLMLQREVAGRLRAAPPDTNLLALAVQAYADVAPVVRVSRGSFRPVPAVDSEVVLLRTRPLGEAERVATERALSIARRAFAHRRKQLGGTFPPDALRAAGIAPSARPQELSLDSWMRLASVLP